MTTLCSHEDLIATQDALKHVEKSYPALFEQLLHIVNLTRSLQLRYQFMGCLLMDEDPGKNKPSYLHHSVLELYKREIQKLKDNPDFPVIKKTFKSFKKVGYAKISLLLQGAKPETLTGLSVIK
ncbi:hypothetical protein SAMN05877753_104207 [Bacillus oleivorans]|uniref:Uncharacterized protein n=1 Tax=Bacillus oleivorans TaxID=1448271 RepID=A0A285CUJ6_9BACI|nr:hypothetical protein [Bacillus oleivorans]SNX70613.1 hypothetical protein SAMN05877753_104207 [Bacillus oleivorans]